MTATAQPQVRAAIYDRISHDKAGDGHGVANQLGESERLASARGFAIVARLSDNDISATNGKLRPGYQQLMAAAARREFDAIVIFQSSRLWRNRVERAQAIEILRTAGVSVVAAKGPSLDMSTAYGRGMAGMLGEFDTMEGEVKAERQRLAYQADAKAGKRHGGPRAFGTTADEAAAIKWAADCLLGGGTVSAVAREWSARGLRPPQSPFGPLPEVPWKRNSVTTVLKNPALAGLRSYRGEIVADGNWAAILPRETWEALRALLGTRDRTIVDRNGRTRRVRARTEAGVRTLLGGLAQCRCGNTLQGSINATGKRIYRCNPATRGDRPGPHGQQMTGPVDGAVTAAILERLSRPDLAELVTPRRPDLGPLHSESAAIRRNLDTLAADMVSGLVSRAQMIAATERGNARLNEISALLAAAAETSALAPFAAGESARAVWDRLDGSRRRAVIAALATITMLPAGRGARRFDPETVVIDWV